MILRNHFFCNISLVTILKEQLLDFRKYISHLNYSNKIPLSQTSEFFNPSPKNAIY